MDNSCPGLLDVMPYLQGDLTSEEVRRVEAHLATCETCADAVRSFSRVRQRLDSTPREHAHPELAARILASIPDSQLLQDQRTRRSASLQMFFGGPCSVMAWEKWFNRNIHFGTSWLARAAVLFLVVGAVFFSIRMKEEPSLSSFIAAPAVNVSSHSNSGNREKAIQQALAWLTDAQEHDGRWDAERWGAQRDYSVGITALSLLALASTSGENPAIQQGVDYLVASQNENGLYGPSCTGSLYNHGMATLAVLKALSITKQENWAQSARKAIDVICASQRPSGGWAYQRASDNAVNASLTIWQLEALLSAQEMGFAGLDESIRKGFAWLESLVDEKGLVGYRRQGDYRNGSETLTAAAAACFQKTKSSDGSVPLAQMMQSIRHAASDHRSIDYYREYFRADSFRLNKNVAELQQICDELLACQSAEGPFAGSWEPVDRWSLAGGRVYATAMAVLALKGADSI